MKEKVEEDVRLLKSPGVANDKSSWNMEGQSLLLNYWQQFARGYGKLYTGRKNGPNHI